MQQTKSSLAISQKNENILAVKKLLSDAVVSEKGVRGIDITKINLPAKTLQEAIVSTSPSIGVIRASLDEARVNALLVKFIKNLGDFFSVGKGMNDAQCAETAKLITTQYYYLNLEDIRICFERIKSGYYGILYDRFDGGVILANLCEYEQERMQMAEIISMDTHRHNKIDERETDYYYLRTFIEDEKEPKYYLKDCGNDNLMEVTEKSEATRFSYVDAIRFRNSISKAGVRCSLESYKKPDIGLIDYAEEKLPHLKSVKEKAEFDRVKLYKMNLALKQIEDSDLSPFDKFNKARELAGLIPLTKKEYDINQFNKEREKSGLLPLTEKRYDDYLKKAAGSKK